jgi:CelD/BcsL family acetyltransferase involved in cellulose biosynthesis
MATCPVADLTGGFEAYLGRLSATARQRARRLLRDGALAGARFEIVTDDQREPAFDELMRLHQTRWRRLARPGVFAANRFVEFHRGLVATWLSSGRAVLARLALGSNSVAVVYGFVCGSRFEFYQSGVETEEAGPLRSPGNLCHLLLMKSLADRGIGAYDFLSGTAPYKKRLATSENPLLTIEIWNSSVRAAACRSARFVGGAFKAACSKLQLA